MNRYDTKFILHVNQLDTIFNTIKNDYNVLDINHNRLMTYQTIYFDTPNARFYHMHHNGIAKRVKVRIRKYVESDVSFLEIKQKSNKGITNKTRKEIGANTLSLNEELLRFVAKTINQSYDLKPSIINQFSRTTLVNTTLVERLTIDTNLSFDGRHINPDLAIIELKQKIANRNSPLFKILKELKIHPYSISKYCIGMASSNPGLKQNRFKDRIRQINKINAA